MALEQLEKDWTVHTSDGHMDLLMLTKDYIYTIEFKMDKSADEALAQMKSNMTNPSSKTRANFTKQV